MESPSLILTAYQDVLSRAMDVVANNVANINTTGYKRQDVQFETFIKRPAPGEELDFISDRATFRDVSMGPLSTTGNPLDLAIQGDGYLPVQTKNGVRYTRSGSFQINAAGEVVTASGEQLMADGNQPIVFGNEVQSVTIASDGVVTTSDGRTTTQAGRIRVVKFPNEQLLKNEGAGLYQTDQTPTPSENSRVVQGMIERSNVDSVSEMNRMITVLRSYQQASRMMDAETQRLTGAISRLARASA